MACCSFVLLRRDCVLLTFTPSAPIRRIYSYDILGAGVGCLAPGTLFVVPPTDALKLVGALGAIAAAVAAWRCAVRPRGIAPALLGTALTMLLLPAEWTRLLPSEYKDLTQALRIEGARVVAERSSPLGFVSVVESPRVPFRHAPGLSLDAPGEPPPQLAFFVDGDGPSALTHYDGRREPLAYLDFVTSAAPYHLLARPRALVLGAGAGADVLQGLYHGARSIDAVELDWQVVDCRTPRGFSASTPPGVASTRRGARLRRLARRSLRPDPGRAARRVRRVVGGALRALGELPVHGRGARRVSRSAERRPPRHHALDQPPRACADCSPRLRRWSSVASRPRAAGADSRLRTVTLLVKNGAFTAADLAALQEFCRARAFDADYFPGIAEGQANLYNRLDSSHFHDGARALLGPHRAAFIERYKYAIAPATDDQPHFFHFFKWRALPEMLSLKAQGGLPLLEWGYPILVATLVQAVLASFLLVLLPLLIGARPTNDSAGARAQEAEREGRGPSRLGVAVYFAALGIAFMFIEIAFIQKFILFLSHPLYAVAVVLCGFLLFAGIGSRQSRRVQRRGGPLFANPVALPVAVIAVVALLYLAVLPAAFRQLASVPDALKIVLAIGLIAPLAIAMGMPFPLGLTRLAGTAEALIPWAWGINACASVIAAILATLLAIHLGFNAVVILAVVLYLAAAAAYRRLGRPYNAGATRLGDVA
jgi:hypothetical protein